MSASLSRSQMAWLALAGGGITGSAQLFQDANLDSRRADPAPDIAMSCKFLFGSH